MTPEPDLDVDETALLDAVLPIEQFIEETELGAPAAARSDDAPTPAAVKPVQT